MALHNTSWLRDKTRDLLTRYRKQYLDYVIHCHGTLPLPAVGAQGVFQVALDRLFVDAHLAPQRSGPAFAGTAPVQSLGAACRTIWDFLDAEPWVTQPIVITGPSGSGKTTLLKHIAVTLARRDQRYRRTGPVRRRKLPVLLNLPALAELVMTNQSMSLPHVLAPLRSAPSQIDADWFETQLTGGNCLVLLDGLDDIADPDQRRQVTTWFEDQIAVYPANRFVVTTAPPADYGFPLNRGLTLEMQPFTREQVAAFSRRWQTISPAGTPPDALIQELQPSFPYFNQVTRPLLLTLIATQGSQLTQLPDQWIELYSGYCRLLLASPPAFNGRLPGLEPAQKQRLWQLLAYQMLEQRQQSITVSEAWEMVAHSLNLADREKPRQAFQRLVHESRGLVVIEPNDRGSLEPQPLPPPEHFERAEVLAQDDQIRFVHRSIQHYLAALYVHEQDLAEPLLARVTEPWWRETMRFYSAQGHADAVLGAYLTGGEPPVSVLRLALDFLADTPDVSPQIRIQMESSLEQALDDDNPRRRRQAAEMLLTRRLRTMQPLGEDTLAAPSPITHAEYQLFLEDRRSVGHYHQPDHWLNLRFPAGQARLPVTGVRPSDALAFCKWLTRREGGFWRYRLPRVGELEVDLEVDEPVDFWVTTADDSLVLASQTYPQTITALDRRLNKTLTRALDLDRDLDLSRDILRALTNDVELAHALGVAQALDLHNALDFARALTHDYDLARNLVLVRALALAHHRARDLAHSLDQPLSRRLEDVYTVTEEVDLFRLFDLDNDLTRARTLALTRNPNRILEPSTGLKTTWTQVARFLQWYIRFVALVIAAELMNPLLPEQLESWLIDIDPTVADKEIVLQELRRLINGYLELYVEFVVLEERMQGNLPAFEGLRLVRERA
ncbi:MAG: NACHT domain-containing protein [Anaerolineae bacterium]|nr:NACHT domain-containing protein [Anaerolineae bacterium]